MGLKEHGISLAGEIPGALPHLERAGKWVLAQESHSVHSSAQGMSGSP